MASCSPASPRAGTSRTTASSTPSSCAQNAKWSNGDPVTASDFVFAYQRIQDPATAAEYANILYPIKNAEKVNKGELKGDQLGVKAVDDHTLEITLEAPTPYFLGQLMHQTGLSDPQGFGREVRRRFHQAGQYGDQRRLHAGIRSRRTTRSC